MTVTTGLGPPTMRRELGVWDRGRPGPTLCVCAGIHGNEGAGVQAVQRVLGRLQEDETKLSGEGAGFSGSLETSSPGLVLATLLFFLVAARSRHRRPRMICRFLFGCHGLV